ncbi:glycosyltransferase [Algibacter lectus]|uniref:Glycosyltransferase involved in cell wall biosynthesis n=1 Tax=Algibacter lectus TaxID=221126 RepID=A0A4R8MGM1_9FLAO|nr:glycosyltransferase [Algibacter lectus]MWW23652.1 glycosyltransferase [Algibacter lectus]TDY63667.1 glycosyltransferase involved in cell wall biosynthesis [Algibacter lectus]
MKNITFFINTLSAAGGTQRVLTSLVNLLVEKYNVTILILDDKQSFFKIKPEVQVKKVVSTKSSIKLFSLIDFNKQVFNELKNSSCDYYISLDSNSVLMQSLFIPRKTKLIIWEHFSLSKNFNNIIFKMSRYYASKRAHKLVLLSQQEVVDWSKIYNIPTKNIALIYNPITIDEKLNFLDIDFYGNKKILAIGNNIHVKGFDYLVRAWGLLDRNDWKLEIVGLSDVEQVKLKDIINQLDIKNEIIVTGRISDIKNKYLEASIYCLCSRMEATPLVLIESQYIGLPAVVFDNCEGPLELLNNSGLIVEFNNINKYANSLSKLIKSRDLYIELSNNARTNSQRFNKDTFFNKWCAVLN